MRGRWIAASLLAAGVLIAGCGAGYDPPAAGATTSLTPGQPGAGSGSASSGAASSSSTAPSSGSASTSSSATSSSFGSGPAVPVPPQVTEADNGKTLTMKVGQTFLLDLGNGEVWQPTVADTHILARVPNIMVIRGAQGVYRALAAGATTLSATGSPNCPKGAPCPLYVILFRVTVQVAAG